MFASPGPSGRPSSHLAPTPSPKRRTFDAPVTDDEHSSCWDRIRGELRSAVPESTWHQWLEPLTGRQSGDGTLLVEAPAELRPWIAKRYGRLLRSRHTSATRGIRSTSS